MNKKLLNFMLWCLLFISVGSSLAFDLDHFKSDQIDAIIAASLIIISIVFMCRNFTKFLKKQDGMNKTDRNMLIVLWAIVILGTALWLGYAMSDGVYFLEKVITAGLIIMFAGFRLYVNIISKKLKK